MYMGRKAGIICFPLLGNAEFSKIVSLSQTSCASLYLSLLVCIFFTLTCEGQYFGSGLCCKDSAEKARIAYIDVFFPSANLRQREEMLCMIKSLELYKDHRT